MSRRERLRWIHDQRIAEATERGEKTKAQKVIRQPLALDCEVDKANWGAVIECHHTSFQRPPDHLWREEIDTSLL